MKIEHDIPSIAGLVRLNLFVKGQTMREAGRELGVSTATVCRMAAGKDFRISTLPALALWAKVSPAELFALIENAS